MKSDLPFVFERTLEHLGHYLPSQTPLKDFVHHNSLHAFQDMPFYEGIFRASEIFGYQVTLHLQEYRKMYHTGRIRHAVLEQVIRDRFGAKEVPSWLEHALHGRWERPFQPRIGRLRAQWKWDRQVDLDNAVHPQLFRILGSFLDQGVALWHFPLQERGLLAAVRTMDRRSYASLLRSRRARALLARKELNAEDVLALLVADPGLYEWYLFDQQFAHPGWSGMVATVDRRPDTILYPKKAGLHDLILLECLMEIDALDEIFGEDAWRPLTAPEGLHREDLFDPVALSEAHQVRMIWQDAFEWSYYDEVLSGLRQWGKVREDKAPEEIPAMQALFCLDDREASLRRHLEAVEPEAETFGAPGFFGVEFYYQPAGGKFLEKLGPVMNTPRHLIREKTLRGKRRRQVLYSRQSHTMVQGLFLTLSLGLWAATKLLLDLFRPKREASIPQAFAHMHREAQLIIEHQDHTPVFQGLQVGFTVPEMAERVEQLLRSIGMTGPFAQLVYVVAHGSSSANNPFHGAYDCGACSGRPGSVNARVLASMANHQGVRLLLREHGLEITDNTRFIGALHDTSTDEITFYDTEHLDPDFAVRHERHIPLFEEALDRNARERARRFASIDLTADTRQVREAIRKRAVSYFEPRPELGHGTNALCFVGHRRLTRGLFFDRRAFMNSYDYRTDPEGSRLIEVLRPLLPVCGGINLEYFFSRMDNERLGAGTKLPHHIMGLVGVANSSDGDLRPGLPQQMVEVHDPVRLLMIVEQDPDVVMRAIQREADIYEWFGHHWVHLVAIRPADQTFHVWRDGGFRPYEPLLETIAEVTDHGALVAATQRAATGSVSEATRENLPVHIIRKSDNTGP